MNYKIRIQNKKPDVSVIIPVYNTEKYLSRCLDSVINQTYKNIEVICVDDCSTDNSLQILKKYQRKDSRIKIFKTLKNSGGCSTPRNIGIKKSSGKYIQFIDSDDYIKLNTCFNLIEISEKNQLDVLCFCNSVINNSNVFSEQNINNNKKYYRLKNYDQYENKIFNGIDLFEKLLINCNFIPCAPFKFINRNFLKKINLFFDEKIIYEDMLFSTFLYLNAKKIMYINDELYIRCYNNNSIITNKINDKNIKSLLYIIKTISLMMNYNDCKKYNLFKKLQSFICLSLQTKLKEYDIIF